MEHCRFNQYGNQFPSARDNEHFEFQEVNCQIRIKTDFVSMLNWELLDFQPLNRF